MRMDFIAILPRPHYADCAATESLYSHRNLRVIMFYILKLYNLFQGRILLLQHLVYGLS
jgi:hypothetical protein